jgi:hypothetical protein
VDLLTTCDMLRGGWLRGEILRNLINGSHFSDRL